MTRGAKKQASRFPLGMFTCMTWCAEKTRAGIRRCRGATTPVVSAVFDINGEVASAVADTYAIVSTASMWLDPCIVLQWIAMCATSP